MKHSEPTEGAKIQQFVPKNSAGITSRIMPFHLFSRLAFLLSGFKSTFIPLGYAKALPLNRPSHNGTAAYRPRRNDSR